MITNNFEKLLKEFPKLYKKTSTGAIQEWQVSVMTINDEPMIVNNYGQVGGKILTVKYQGMTKYGQPRFPVGMRFREDI